MSELSSADDDHPLKLSDGSCSANNGGSGSVSGGGGGMSFASLSVSIYTRMLTK